MAPTDQRSEPAAAGEGPTDPSRRKFFALSAGVAGAATVAGLGLAGAANGSSPKTSPYWEHAEGFASSPYFDRSPFLVERPTYQTVRTQRRIHWTERVVERGNAIAKFVAAGQDKSKLPPELVAYYAKRPGDFDLDLERVTKIIPNRAEQAKKDADEFLLTNLYDKAWYTVKPEMPGHPRESDWKDVSPKKYEVKDPVALSRLVKKLGTSFGAALVGITRLNPAWVYRESTFAWRGYKELEEIEIPKWWEYAIVLGVPHDWDLVKSRPMYGSDEDGYNTSGIAAARLATVIKGLGYPARIHSLDAGWEVVFPPIAIDAGLGQQGRFGYCLTPELGANFRPAVVTTSLPMQADRPIDVNMHEFCMNCGICSEQCPAQAIPSGPPAENRGNVKWTIDTSACFNYRMTSRGSATCGICLAVCPWTKKENLIHGTAREAMIRDRTGLLAKAAVAAEKALYPKPVAVDYYGPTWASVKEPPWWMRPENFFSNVK